MKKYYLISSEVHKQVAAVFLRMALDVYFKLN